MLKHNITVSLDGYVATPDTHSLGKGGERLHQRVPFRH